MAILTIVIKKVTQVVSQYNQRFGRTIALWVKQGGHLFSNVLKTGFDV